LEKHYGPKWGVDLKETISLIIALSLVYLISNLWIYITKLYAASLWSFLQGINVGVLAVVGAFFFHFFWKGVAKIDSFYRRILFVIAAYIIFSGITAFLVLFTNGKGMTFSFLYWLAISGVILLLLILMTVYEELRRGKKKEAQ
jgi:hypothetical protein